MAFRVLFIAHAPDANKEKHHSVIQTEKYILYAVVVRNQEEALEVCKQYIEEKEIDSIILCPGFTHEDVAELFRTVGGKVGVSVARGDGPSNRISHEAIKREGYF